MEYPTAKKETLLTLVFNNMITHFANKAWIVTWEIAGDGLGCRNYGIYGIYNKKNLADIAADKCKKEYKLQKRRFADVQIQEVTLDGSHQLFQYLY